MRIAAQARPGHIAAAARRAALCLPLLAGTIALVLIAPCAEAEENLARERACFACHQVDKKLVGPALRDVAIRYAGDGDAQARLARKIRAGGAGAWGTLAMAPNPAVTEADAIRLARWVLSLNRPG